MSAALAVIVAVFTVTGAISWLLTALVVVWVVRDARKVRSRQRERASEVVAHAEALLRDAAAGR